MSTFKEKRKKNRTSEEFKTKGYNTYKNKDGVICITNFDPYNMGGGGMKIYHAGTPIQTKSIPRTISSDIIY